MSEIMEKIATIELEMSRTQKNKATASHLVGAAQLLHPVHPQLAKPPGCNP
jgi:ribosome-interacting GTPase 1